MLFWFVYIIDKTISLRLGHASAIQDFEVVLPKPQPSETFSASLVHLMTFWIDVSRVQGQIAEQLYSPAALTQTSSVRANRAESLAQELREAYEVRVKVRRICYDCARPSKNLTTVAGERRNPRALLIQHGILELHGAAVHQWWRYDYVLQYTVCEYSLRLERGLLTDSSER